MYAVRAAVLAVAGVVALSATGVRIGNHPAYVRIVVDFNGRVPARQVEFDKLTARRAFLHIAHPGIAARTSGSNADGVFVTLQPGTRALHVTAAFARSHFKYLSYAVVTGDRLAIDLWKNWPPTTAAEIRRGAGGCLALRSWRVSSGSIAVRGAERGIFEHTFRVVVRGEHGQVLGRKTVVDGRSWATTVRYHATHRQQGTLEAVAFSSKDGALTCIAQVRVTLPPN